MRQSLAYWKVCQIWKLQCGGGLLPFQLKWSIYCKASSLYAIKKNMVFITLKKSQTGTARYEAAFSLKIIFFTLLCCSFTQGGLRQWNIGGAGPKILLTYYNPLRHSNRTWIIATWGQTTFFKSGHHNFSPAASTFWLSQNLDSILHSVFHANQRGVHGFFLFGGACKAGLFGNS